MRGGGGEEEEQFSYHHFLLRNLDIKGVVCHFCQGGVGRLRLNVLSLTRLG